MAKFKILCKGRDVEGHETLKKPIMAEVLVTQKRQPQGLVISVECVHSCGYNGSRCGASKKQGNGNDENYCPYRLELPEHADKLYHKLASGEHE